MSTRDYLRRRKRNALLVQWGSVLALLLGLALWNPPSSSKAQAPSPSKLPGWVAPVVIFAPFCLLMGITSQWPACPSCKASLFNFRLRQREKHQVNFCPYCALRLDDPKPESARP